MYQSKNLNIQDLELNEGQVYGLPKNPRWIRDERFAALKKSIEDAPEMLALRELIVWPLDSENKPGKYIILCGNMRFRACKEIGYKEIPCKVLDLETPVKKLREYTIKDNESFGQNDFDVLANEWDSDELLNFGMEIDNFQPSTIDFDRVDDIDKDNYETPTTKMLECPKCHHRDFAIHFKSVDAITNAEAEVDLGEEDDDMPEDENE